MTAGRHTPGAGRTAPATTLWPLFEHQVAAHAAKVAVRDVDAAYTYAETHAKATAVAATLAAAGARPGDPVVLCVDRTAHAVVAALGVAAAGLTAVPVEVDGPPARQDRILGSADAKLALVDDAGARTLDGSGLGCVAVREAARGNRELTPQPPAEIPYLLFTSGSTGVPKGVEITQGNLLSLLTGADVWEGSTAEDVWAAASAFTFDASMWEMWRPLTLGCEVFVLPRAAQVDVSLVAELVERYAVTTLCQTPTAAGYLADAVATAGRPPTLRRLLLGGERVEFARFAPFAAAIAAGEIAVWNMYGPTETTVYATGHRITADDIAGERRSLIGRPLPGVAARVHDPGPDGAGELWLSGPGVSAGYRGDPDLTAERFVVDERGVRAYRTADIARDTGDGVLEFLGRSSGYVKVRGYRVEPGEVAAALRSHPDVADAVATVTDVLGLGESVVAGVVLRDGARATEHDIRRHVRTLLPTYMRPARVVVFDAFPTLASSKLDERAAREAVVERLVAAE